MTTVTTLTSPKAFGLDVLGLAPESTIPNSVLLTATTKAGEVEGDDVFVRVPLINVDDSIGFVAEGAEIDEGEPDLSETVIGTGKVAALFRLSKEQLRQPAVQDILTAEIKRALQNKANVALLQTPAPVSPAVWPPAGLLTYAVAGGATITNDLDPVIDAVADIESLGGSCTNIIAAPDAWASLAMLKKADTSNESLLGAGTESAVRTLLNIPVLVTSAMPSKKILLVDKTKTLSAYGSIEVARSEHAFFGSDSIGLRATFRFGSKFTQTGAGIVLTVA